MDLKLSHLEALLRFPGTNATVADASVLSCGCLVSESQFLGGNHNCPVCQTPETILKSVAPLRELHKIVLQLERSHPRRLSLKRSARLSDSKLPSFSHDSMDLLALFCKYAKEEHNPDLLPDPKPVEPSELSVSPLDRFVPSQIERQKTVQTHHSQIEDVSLPENYEHNLLMGLNESEEYNFSRCFPFHRKCTAFQTQQNKFSKLLFPSSIKKTRFSGSAMCTLVDPATAQERTVFVLISDKRWELYEYTGQSGKPALIACGKLTGEYGPLPSALRTSTEGMIVRNEFSGSDKNDEDGTDDLATRLKSWVQLTCCLSDKLLVISGTKGVVRVLNVDSSIGGIGMPVYTYLTNFPIRCAAIAPSNNLVACGITARERMSGKQQPFIILHKIDTDAGKLSNVTPITITVPYRDPLKILTFNASSTHLMCCTVYEMRYFIIRLRGDGNTNYRKPRLIWSDVRVSRKARIKDDGAGSDNVDDFLNDRDDDQMMDNEGITDVKFGLPFTNTVVVTTSSLKNRPSIVLKLNGPTIDSRVRAPRMGSDFFYDGGLHVSAGNDSDEDDNTNIADVDILMKVPEIGSSIYKVQLSPRGDGMVFVDKSGRLLLVSTPNVQLNLVGQAQSRKIVVLLGEAADSNRFNEAASVEFSTDGGKVFVVDRRGLFQVFDFTKGIPGEDSEVIKCKIISA